MKGFEKNYVTCIHEEDRKTLDKSETKILKSKSPRTLGDSGKQRERVDEKRGKELYTTYIGLACDL